jgi:hypothetical protein
MKKLTTAFTIGLVLTGHAVTAAAGQVDREQLGQCKAELKKVYGDDARVKLKSIKRSRVGNQMRLQAIPAEGGSQMVTCWLDDAGAVNMVDKQGVALAVPVNTGDQVSLND